MCHRTDQEAKVMRKKGMESWKTVVLFSFITLLLLGTSWVKADDWPSIFNKQSGAHFRDLQEAINAADDGDTLFIDGTNVGNFIIAKNLTLIGKCEAVLDGNNKGTVVTTLNPFAPFAVLTITLDNLKITHGLAGVEGGGGILNLGAELIINQCDIVHNVSPIEVGGGIANFAFLVGAPATDDISSSACLTLINTNVSKNQSGTSGGGIANIAGCMEIKNCRVNSNTAAISGGGILSFGGENAIKYTRIAHNFALQGGGLENVAFSLTALTDVEFISNGAGEAGGVFNGSAGVFPSSIAINNSEFKGNNSHTFGGGLFNETGSSAVFDDSRVIKNGAASGGGIFNAPGGLLQINETEVRKNIPDNIVNL